MNKHPFTFRALHSFQQPSRALRSGLVSALLPAMTAALLSGCAVLPVSFLPGLRATTPADAEAARLAAVQPFVPVGAAQRPAASASSPTSAPGAPPSAGSPPPFAAVVRDATRIDGPIALWQKEERVWIELTPEQFGVPYLLSPKLKSGIGEAFLFGGLMAFPVSGAGGQQVVEFVRVHNQVRLQARNLEIVARPDTPEARAVEAGYSASLLGSTPVASQPHPERKSVLVDANNLFLTDLLGVAIRLQRAFRQNYNLDLRNSVISAVRGSPEATVIETQNHYYTATLMQGSGASGGNAPSLPSYVPDTRSLFVSHHYSLAPLPAQPMAARRADPRIGLFSNTVLDFGDDLTRSPRKRIVNRWRLEKKDPAAALSEPVKPITYWIDRNVPLKYRATVAEAILEWNKAFEAIGLRNAIAVRQQPDDAAFDTLDFGYASVRWMMNANPGFGAIGPRHIDPRTGEILDADIAFEGLESRRMRSLRSQVLPASLGNGAAPADASAPAPSSGEMCTHAEMAAEQLGYALDVLEARSELDLDSAQAQQFVLDSIRETILHEVGHTLGLRHNFRASRAYSEAQLSDVAYTRANGTTGSVMEYHAINLARPGETAGTPFQLTLGPYDYWAIEYAYKQLTAEEEGSALQRIAARSSEPLLAYGTDEDNDFGIDPETIQLDLGSDPIAFASRRIDIARDLFARQETRVLKPEQDYSVLRRSLNYALADVGRAIGVLTRQIGGVRTLRDFPGSGRDPLEPVPLATQRRALDLISQTVLAGEGLTVSAALQRRLAPDFQDRSDWSGVPTDYPVQQRLLELQRAVLRQLMSDAVAARILDSEGKARSPAEAFHLADLYPRLTRDLWTELASGAEIGPARREIQREHVNRLAELLLRPSGLSRADARGLLRSEAQQLLARLQVATKRNGLAAPTQAHLRDSVETLSQALAARLVRTGA
ncbi:MAG: zinc-dependent metalloprotease [Burkholderiaceae bacterium]